MSFSDVISLIALSFSFFVLLENVYRSWAKIKIKQTNHIVFESFDGSHYAPDDSDPLSPFYDSIGLVEVIITNNSSLPLSFLEFKSSGSVSFSSISETKDWYSATKKDGNKLYFGRPNDPLKYLTPEFTLDPYTSIRGYLFFWITDLDEFKKKQKLTIITSRKSFSKKLNINYITSTAHGNTQKEAKYKTVGELFNNR